MPDIPTVNVKGNYYYPIVIETSEGKYLAWELHQGGDESSEPPAISFEEFKGDKGDTGERGPVTEITKIEPIDTSEGVTVYGVYTNTQESSEVLLNTFEFDLGKIIWDCGTSTEVIGPDWGDDYIPEV
jgi:hypothetical protein